MNLERKKVIVTCVDCGRKDEIIGGEIPEGEYPICNCGGIMMIRNAIFESDTKEQL